MPAPDGPRDTGLSRSEVLAPMSRWGGALAAWASSLGRPAHHGAPINVYHCCVHKAGSQWLRAILADDRVYRHTGLARLSYEVGLPGGRDPRRLTERTFDEPFPPNTIVSPIYIDFKGFVAIPKPEPYRAFFVMRDPRDLVVSRYFSMKYSHVANEFITQHRAVLHGMSRTEGLLHVIDHFDDFGVYAALGSWIDASERDPNVLVVRFEDLTVEDNLEPVRRLFWHCAIRMPDRVLRRLLRDYSFERLGGRPRGQEDQLAHYRKGVPGDWRNYFDDRMMRRFHELTGDLVARLGYDDTTTPGNQPAAAR
jgi:hypothetical protein